MGEKLKQQITGYKPVIVDSENLDNNYKKHFWNIIRNDFRENNKYSQIITLLKFVKLFIISNKNENTNIFSITRIKEKLENRDCNDDELILIDKIYDMLEKYYEESDSQKYLIIKMNYGKLKILLMV